MQKTRTIAAAATVAALVSGCGLFIDFAEVAAVSETPRPFARFDGKRVAVVALNLPVNYAERELALPRRLHQELVAAIAHHGGTLVYGRRPTVQQSEATVVRSDAFDWFFRSESNSRERLEQQIDLTGVDYFLIVDILRVERGVRRANDWIELNIQIYRTSDGGLDDLVVAKGFFASLQERLQQRDDVVAQAEAPPSEADAP